MKNTFSHQKTSQRKVHQNEQRATAGPDGASVAPSNRTGLPDALKTGIESLSGLGLNDVRVHYNSPKPAQLQALAYTQGMDIHVAPGQERHLAHEAWHVVQQAQGRVQPTMQLKDVPVNDDIGLEHEADVMGTQALTRAGHLTPFTMQSSKTSEHGKACSCVSCDTSSLTRSAQLITSTQHLNGAHNSSCNCPSCQTSTTPAVAVQRKGCSSSYGTVQLKKACLVCGHKHGASDCKTQVPDPQNPGHTKDCGCKSHSSKFDSGAKFNPGSGKRARMLEKLK